MKIERINKGKWGNVVAFVDLRTEEGLVVKGFTIVNGPTGPFVGYPSKQKEGEWNPTVYAEDALKQEITRLCLDAYGASNNFEHPDQVDLADPEMPF